MSFAEEDEVVVGWTAKRCCHFLSLNEVDVHSGCHKILLQVIRLLTGVHDDRRATSCPKNTFASVKRLIGRRLDEAKDQAKMVGMHGALHSLNRHLHNWKRALLAVNGLQVSIQKYF